MSNQISLPFQKFARIPPYLERFRRLKEEEQRRWEEEKREEARRLENMKLSDEEREKILQVGNNKRPRREEKVIRFACRIALDRPAFRST